jgi:hypothetical protein
MTLTLENDLENYHPLLEKNTNQKQIKTGEILFYFLFLHIQNDKIEILFSQFTK